MPYFVIARLTGQSSNQGIGGKMDRPANLDSRLRGNDNRWASFQLLAGRHRLFAAIVIEAAIGFAAQPSGLDIFHQQRAGPVF